MAARLRSGAVRGLIRGLFAEPSAPVAPGLGAGVASCTRWPVGGETMKSVDERYAELLGRWIEDGDEPSAMVAARSLGAELDEQGVPRAAMEEIHAGALRRVAEAHPDRTLAEVVPRAAELMLEIGRAYETARRRRRTDPPDADDVPGGLADDDFLSLLTHELRTPLSPILTWAEVLRVEGVDSAQAGVAFDSIERNARALQAMIDDLSVAAQAASGRLPYMAERVDLAPIARDVVESFRGEAGGKGVRLRLNSEAVLPVRGDSRRLRQILRNLVANGVKFTSQGGRVDVDASRAGSMVRIAVSDTGRGIGAADLNRIFDRVWPVSSAITRRHRGLGLGLAVVHQLVKLHEGSVVAESAGRGQGATFAVEIPAASPAIDDTEAGRTRAVPGDLADLRILVVDDEVDAVEAASALLRHWGADVRTVSSAEEALGALADFSPQLLVSDLAMPRHDGYALMLAIRENESRTGTPRLPAIALTAHSREQERRKAISAGFDAVVSKPIESGELLDTVGVLVGRP